MPKMTFRKLSKRVAQTKVGVKREVREYMAIWMIFNLECWLASDMLDAYLIRLVPPLHNIYIWVARQTPRIFNLMIGVYLAERRKESREGLESRVTSYWVVVASHVLGARVWNGHTFIDIFLLAHRGHGAHCAHSSLRPEARTCCSSTAANLLDSTRSCNTRMANKKMYQDMYLTSLPSANMYMLFKSLLSRTYSYKICHSRHSNHSKEALKRSLLVEWTASLMQKVKKRLDHLLDSVVPLAILWLECVEFKHLLNSSFVTVAKTCLTVLQIARLYI